MAPARRARRLASSTASPLQRGLLGYRFKRTSEASWKAWTLLAFLALITHTASSTASPSTVRRFFSRSVTTRSLSPASLLSTRSYTVPLLAGLVAALFMKRTSWQEAVGETGSDSALARAYLLATLGIKAHVHGTFEASLASQDVRYEKLLTAPMPFNTLLWMGLAHKRRPPSRVGLYSVLDEDSRIAFEKVATHQYLLAPYKGQTPRRAAFCGFSAWLLPGPRRAAIRSSSTTSALGRTDAWLNR